MFVTGARLGSGKKECVIFGYMEKERETRLMPQVGKLTSLKKKSIYTGESCEFNAFILYFLTC